MASRNSVSERTVPSGRVTFSPKKLREFTSPPESS